MSARNPLPFRGMWLTGVGCTLLAATAAAAQPMQRVAETLRQEYAGQLDALADWATAQGLADRARQTRQWHSRHDPYKLYLARLPDAPLPADLPEGATAAENEWYHRFLSLRRDQAEAQFQLARAALRGKRPSLAYDLVLSAVRENPDHEALRKMLGYQLVDGRWCTFYEASKLRAGQVWDSRWGWLSPEHLQRYEAGQRYYRGRWISIEDDVKLHRDIRQGWLVESEHYAIRTNHSREAGVELSERLETLYRVWQQLFIAFTTSGEELQAMFEGRGLGRRPGQRRHQVWYYRDRADYVQSLQAVVPNVETSIGVYVAQDKLRRAFFFAGEGSDPQTLIHEATHQLFHESRPVAGDVGQRSNFWIVEGIAMFMESLRIEDGYYVLGGFDDARLKAARYRMLAPAPAERFHVPLAEFTSWGMEQVQLHPRVATVYSEAAGLTHFLVFAKEGEYRDALVAYLLSVYSGQATPDTLSRLTGLGYDELDRQYLRFMEESLKVAPPTQ